MNELNKVEYKLRMQIQKLKNERKALKKEKKVLVNKVIRLEALAESRRRKLEQLL